MWILSSFWGGFQLEWPFSLFPAYKDLEEEFNNNKHDIFWLTSYS